MRRHLRETETETETETELVCDDDDDGAVKETNHGADCVLFPMTLLLPQLGPSEKVPQRRQKPIWWQLLW
jgi:hypothetical protein